MTADHTPAGDWFTLMVAWLQGLPLPPLPPLPGFVHVLVDDDREETSR